MIKNVIIAIILLMTAILPSNCDRVPSGADMIYLPQTIGEWTLASRKAVDEDEIFDYMNGAGEIYLGYRFQWLEVFEYMSPAGEDLIVEIYRMETADDAFGLLSMDWGGEPVILSGFPDSEEAPSHVPPARALYGMGLLRLWAGTIYARVLAYRETEASRKAVMELASIISGNRTIAPRPQMLALLPQDFHTTYRLVSDHVHYLRSYLVLNSLFFVSSRNILNLDHSTEAVLAAYAGKDEPDSAGGLQTILIRYESDEKARQASGTFLSSFVPEKIPGGFQPENDMNYIYEIEDGWMGCSCKNNCLNLVFNSPDAATVQSALNALKSNY